MGTPILLTKGTGNTIHVTFDSATCSSDHAAVLFGTLGNFGDYAGEVDSGCNAGSTGAADFSVAASNVWFNLVWVDSSGAGGHPGFATSGARTWLASGLCSIATDNPARSTCP